ncbi:MAG: hypothetical protein QF718_00190 [Phycisphaerales bacterium]|jgi:membrane-bound serine protease (ClpP class)|nr:hypothetical protein [Phycisphaerales bacterium]
MLSIIAGIIVTQQVAPVPSYRQATDISVITIDGVVDTVTAQSFKRRLAESSNADALVIDLNTPGGDLMSTLEICYELKNNAPQNTVAWIHPHAFSAGTIIALACREIVVAPGCTFGDAAPITSTGHAIPATERAKIESPVLVEVIDSARRNHYDEHLVEAFVSVGVELWLLKNRETEEIICVNSIEYEQIFDKEPPRNFTPIGTSIEKIKISPFFDSITNITSGIRKNEPTWDPSFAQQLPSSRKQLTSQDSDEWELVKQIVPKDRLLTLKPAEAEQYGLIVGVIANDKELKQWFGATSLTRHETNWSEGLVRLLISWPIRLVLIAVFLVCIFVEFVSGSTGAFSIGAVVSMSLLVGAPWLAGLAQWWDILLVLLGLFLISIEIFVIPGTGFTGLAGIACLFAGMVGSFISGDLRSPEGQTQLFTGIAAVIGGCILAVVGAWAIAKHFGDSFAMQRLVLASENRGKSRKKQSTPKVGTIGVATTDLRPSGRISVADTVYDANTSGQWISEGTTIRIIRTGLTIEVEEHHS